MRYGRFSQTWASTHHISVAAIACAVVLITVYPASAQEQVEPQNGRSVLSSAPIPEGDAAAVIKKDRLVESVKPVREMIGNWRKPPKVVVAGIDNTHRLAWLQEVAPGVKLVPVSNNTELKKEIVDADVLISGCNKDLVSIGTELRWIQQEHTGDEACFTGNIPEQLASGKVLVSNNKGLHADPISYHAIALMTALTRGLDIFAAQRQTGHLDRTKVPPGRLWTLEGRTMLVVGLGGIGTDMAQFGHDFGMNVIATRATSHEGPSFVSYVGLSDELPNLIGKADVVMVATPLTNETKGMFNAAMFNRMKKGALFVSISREELLVESDLVAALASGQVGAAGLELDAGGRNSDNNPLMKAPNVILTPHTSSLAVGGPGGAAADSNGGEDTWVYIRENLRRYVNGEKLLSVVNPKLGY